MHGLLFFLAFLFIAIIIVAILAGAGKFQGFCGGKKHEEFYSNIKGI